MVGGVLVRQNVYILLSSVLITVLVMAGCQSAGGSPGASEAEPAVAASNSEVQPSLDELRNATYRGFEGEEGPVALVDGIWEGEPFYEGGASRPRVRFVGDFMTAGDLDGDGIDEAVVLLSESPGGSGTFLYLAVVDRNGEDLDNVATEFVGDRVQVRGARVDDGKIFLDVLRAGPTDAACCPGELATVQWKLSPEGGLREVASSEEPDRFSLKTIGDTEWVLAAWAFDEPAPAEPRVTLSHKDGSFVGTSGCNSYFASVEQGEMPGDVSVGPAGATRMACPEPEMDVESRYLQQLGSVNRVGFVATQLALSYEKDGVLGVMLFDDSGSDAAKIP
jgi:heat shock protein HslJ